MIDEWRRACDHPAKRTFPKSLFSHTSGVSRRKRGFPISAESPYSAMLGTVLEEQQFAAKKLEPMIW
jgi:hypothetical protein